MPNLRASTSMRSRSVNEDSSSLSARLLSTIVPCSAFACSMRYPYLDSAEVLQQVNHNHQKQKA